LFHDPNVGYNVRYERSQLMTPKSVESDEFLPTGLVQNPRSESWLRDGAEAQGFSVTHAQFTSYQRAGVLPLADQSGRYPEWTLAALIRIRNLGSAVRPLPRRVIRLRGDWNLFPVSGANLKAAMLATIPSIKAPRRKLRRMAVDGKSQGDRRLRRRLPTPAEWIALVERAPAERIEMWAVGWYAMVVNFIPAYHHPNPNPLADIPLEEQVILYAILDLAGPHASLGGLI